jgi:ribosomal protein S14
MNAFAIEPATFPLIALWPATTHTNIYIYIYIAANLRLKSLPSQCRLNSRPRRINLSFHSLVCRVFVRKLAHRNSVYVWHPPGPTGRIV